MHAGEVSKRGRWGEPVRSTAARAGVRLTTRSIARLQLCLSANTSAAHFDPCRPAASASGRTLRQKTANKGPCANAWGQQFLLKQAKTPSSG